MSDKADVLPPSDSWMELSEMTDSLQAEAPSLVV